MKHVHIFPNSGFTESFINFIQEKFPVNEHLFILYGKSNKTSIERYENVIELSRKLSILLKTILEIYNSERLYLHGLFNTYILIFFFIQPWLLKRCFWVMWGGDLYCYNLPRNGYKEIINEFVRRYCIKRFQGIISLTPGDFELAKKWYDLEIKGYLGMYINPVKEDFLMNFTNKASDLYNIQIGNSSDPSNNHIELIDMLKKFSEQNIRLFAPLSYGNKEHALKVKEYGEQFFGEKFIALMDYMNPEDYAIYLNSIDVLIFNHNRQQGLGNIYSLLYLGKKVFVRSDVTSWDFLIKTIGVKIDDTNSIGELDFEEVISNEFSSMNKKIAKDTFYNKDFIFQLWEKIFE